MGLQREEGVNVFREWNRTFTETKRKGNGEISWSEVCGICSGVQENERVRRGVTALQNDVWHNDVFYFVCDNSRISSGFQGLRCMLL